MIIDGKQLAQEVIANLKREPALRRIAGRAIAALVVGGNEEIMMFVRQKQRVGKELGLEVRVFMYPETISLSQLLEEIHTLNVDPGIVGIIVQLPLPKHLDVRQVFNAIAIRKDSDALSDAAFLYFCTGTSCVIPPVAGAIAHMISKTNMALENRFAVVVGAGRLVGIPTLALLSRMNVYACSFQGWSDQVPLFLRYADIIVSGIGKPHIITADMVKPGAVVFDAGYGFCKDTIAGDVDFASVEPKASFITPVPGGIGPLTVAMLFRNIVELNK